VFRWHVQALSFAKLPLQVLLSILNECVLHVESDPTTTNLRVLNVMKSDVWEIVADHGVLNVVGK
jgi:hypothetical protein